MIEFRRILCPTDFSVASQHALEHAVAIAKWYESQIIGLHVSSSQTSTADGQTKSDQLQAWLTPARTAAIDVEAVLDEGNVATGILDCAVSRALDLIVLGTHSVSGFERLVLGSVTEKIVRKSPCPGAHRAAAGRLTIDPAVQAVALSD